LSNATIHTAAAQLTHELHRTAKHSVQSSVLLCTTGNM